MPEAISLTLNEAGFVVGQSSTAINRAVDRGPIRAETLQKGRLRIRRIGPAELRYLVIVHQVEKDLTPAGRRRVYQAVRRLPTETPVLTLGAFELKLGDIDRRISERLARLQQIKAYVDARDGGDPTVRDSTIPVYALAALAKSQTIAEIAEDYPGLSPAQIGAAIDYAKIYPRSGRPLPTRSLKRMLAEAAASGLWEETDTEPLTPRSIP